MWNGGYKQACCVATFRSLINNACIGVTEVSNNKNNLNFSKLTDLQQKDEHVAIWCVYSVIYFFSSI